MPLKATRGSQKKQTKGRKRSVDEDIDQQTAQSTASQLSPDAAAAMTGEGAEEKQAGSDAAATPLSKKARLARAAAAVLPSSSAAHVSSASSSSSSAAAASPPSPCARLDLDSLSVVFSLLNMRDFLYAIRVCRHWRSARTKKTAWPAFNLETMIQQLREDDFDNPQRRKLEVAVKTGDQKKLGALLRRPGVMELWRHVTEIKLGHTQSSDPLTLETAALRASTVMMQLLPQFASLVALTLDGFQIASDSPAIELFDALSSRLLMLGLFRCSFAFGAQLHRLSSLRVLVLGWIPEAKSLLPLHRLVYLHLQRESSKVDTPQAPLRFDALLGYTIRWLSVHHQLRSFSVEGVRGWIPTGHCPTHKFLHALLSCDQPAATDAATLADLNQTLNPPLDPTAPCALSDLSLNSLAPASKSLLGSLPALTRLQIGVEDPEWGQAFSRLFTPLLAPSLQLTLPRLRQLRMEGDSQPYWHRLALCTALRTVHLTQFVTRWHDGSTVLTRATLQPLLHAWSLTLEECRLDLKMEFGGAGSDEWHELAACHLLRVLELRLEKGQPLPDGLVAALQELPSFRSLALSFDGPAVCLMPPNLLAVMARSRSFSTLHLHALSAGSRAPDFVQSKQGDGLSSMLSALPPTLLTAAVVDRIRVFGHRGAARVASAQCFRIATGSDERHVWEREN